MFYVYLLHTLLCIDTEEKRRKLREAQGTVILHLTHLAQHDPALARDYIKLLKPYTWLPQSFCSTFNLPLSLSLTSIHRYEDQVGNCNIHCWKK